MKISKFTSVVLLSATLISFLSAKDSDLLMATTTSTDNTGLLDVIAPEYKKLTGVDIKWTAVGTGNALEMGKNCDVDVLLVHSPAVEKKFVKDGFGIDRTPIMYNDFVLIANPKFKEKFSGKKLEDIFKQIKSEGIKFFSRGDKSGTHNKEVALWKSSINANPDKESWYNQTGQGMLNTINIAEQQDGITLTDRGTYIKYASNHNGNPPLVIISEGDEGLKNFYATISVNPQKCPKADIENATEFKNWLSSEAGQKFIADYKLMDKQLFYPDAKTRKE